MRARRTIIDMIYIAFVTKGLESISVDELSSIEGIHILDVTQKFIRFSYGGNSQNLAWLKTVDDVGILVDDGKLAGAEFDPGELLPIDSLKNAIKIVSDLRNSNDTFSITLSVYKNETDRDELQTTISKYIQEKLRFQPTLMDHSNLDIRVNIDGPDVFTSIKLFPQSLYKRDYDHKTQLGTLRSTIAAAMLYKLQVGKNMKVFDNFCGSGTFLCEAASMGAVVYGGDIDPNAVALTTQNLASLQVHNPQVFAQNAAKTTWPDKTFDIAVANFPWDKQVEVANFSELFEGAIKEYARILKPNGKCAFISTNPTLLLKYIKKYFSVKKLEEFKIGYLGQTPTIQLFKL